MISLTLTLFTTIFIIILGIRKKRALKHTKKYFQSTFIIAVLIGLISGLIVGTAYSHGFDIPWWVFSFFSFIIILLPSIILIGLMRIKL